MSFPLHKSKLFDIAFHKFYKNYLLNCLPEGKIYVNLTQTLIAKLWSLICRLLNLTFVVVEACLWELGIELETMIHN